MVLGVDIVVAILVLQPAHVAVAGRARAGDHGLAAQVAERADAGVGADQHAHGRDIVRDAESHLLLALERVGVGGAIEVDQAVDHRGNAVLRRQWHPAHFQVFQAQLLARRFGSAQAQVDRIAGRLALVVGKGKGQRRFAVAQHDGAGIADLVEHGGLRLGTGRSRRQRGDQDAEGERRKGATRVGQAGGQGRQQGRQDRDGHSGNRIAGRRRGKDARVYPGLRWAKDKVVISKCFFAET
ncbi:hypothetical protein D9M68_539250 [compost metagenome]